jgi:hypothetical protein
MRILSAPCLIGLLVVLLASAAASDTIHRLGGSFDLGYPQEQFRDNVDNTGVGAGVFLSIGFPDVPMSVGASLDFMEYGSESRQAPWSTTIPDVFVDVNTSNNLLAGHLFLRLQPPHGFFQPYLEGLIGFHYLWTSTSVHDQGGDGEEIASTKHISDLVLSYGATAGVMFRVWSPSKDSEPPTKLEVPEHPYGGAEVDTMGVPVVSGSNVSLESVGIFLDVRYLRGGEADYLREGSIQVQDGRVEYDVRRSRTDIVVVRIGISLNLM